VVRAHLGQGDPPLGLRNNRTSGPIIKRLVEASLKRSREIALERGDAAAGAPATIDDATIAAIVPATVEAAAAADGEAPETAAAEARKAQRREQKVAADTAADQARCKLVLEDKRPVTVVELRAGDVGQKMLRLYNKAAGLSARSTAAALADLIEKAGKAEYCAGDALL
jgi:hypothetical protein